MAPEAAQAFQTCYTASLVRGDDVLDTCSAQVSAPCIAPHPLVFISSPHSRTLLLQEPINIHNRAQPTAVEEDYAAWFAHEIDNCHCSRVSQKISRMFHALRLKFYRGLNVPFCR